MALHTQLPIYKLAYDLLTNTSGLIKNLPREYKNSLGKRIHDECIDLVVFIFRANCATDKKPHLDELLERVQVVELLLRLCKDLRCISAGQYAGAIQLTDQIGKQANGWRKHSATSPAAPASRR
jgi:hypothetical protein